MAGSHGDLGSWQGDQGMAQWIQVPVEEKSHHSVIRETNCDQARSEVCLPKCSIPVTGTGLKAARQARSYILGGVMPLIFCQAFSSELKIWLRLSMQWSRTLKGID